MSEWHTGLETTLAQVWQRLARGVADRRAAARHPTLATVGASGPEARTVVLRGFDETHKRCEIHTDRRAGKVASLAEDPRAALHIWDAKAHLQVRLRCDAELIHGDPAAWARIPEGAQRVYGGTPPPAAVIETPQDHDPTPDRADFTRVLLHIAEIETLHLGKDLHRRARFTRADDWQGTWLAP